MLKTVPYEAVFGEPEVLSELSVNQLANNSRTVSPNSTGRQNAVDEVRILSKSYQKIDKNKLLVVAKCQGSETNKYTCQILIANVPFVTSETPQAIDLQNGMFILSAPNSRQTQVSCSCLDFHWTFAWHNSANSALMGQSPSPYRSTGLRPPRNPRQVAGMCKHLLKLVRELKSERIVK